MKILPTGKQIPGTEQNFLSQENFLATLLRHSCGKQQSPQTKNFVQGITKHRKICVIGRWIPATGSKFLWQEQNSYYIKDTYGINWGE